MGKHKHHHDKAFSTDHHGWQNELETLQIGLSAMQRKIMAGTIKRIAEHMSPRDTRVVALGIPTAQDQKAWYFQRWCAHLPVSGEIALFNRSWYNRAGVEHVMGFCTDTDYEEFMATVPLFEQLLVHSGVTVIKYYLDISRGEQKARLKDRARDPLKQWKTSPIDAAAIKNWKAYTKARDAMLARTHSVFAPWTIIRADDKVAARLAVIRDLLARLGTQDDTDFGLPDPTTAFLYDPLAREKGWLAE